MFISTIGVLLMGFVFWGVVYIKYRCWFSSPAELVMPEGSTWHLPLVGELSFPHAMVWFVVLPVMVWCVNRVCINEFTVHDYEHDLKHFWWMWLKHHGWSKWITKIIHGLTGCEVWFSHWFSLEEEFSSDFSHTHVEWIKNIMRVLLVLPLVLLLIGKVLYLRAVAVIVFNYYQPGTAAWLNEEYDASCYLYAAWSEFYKPNSDLCDKVGIGIIVLLIILFIFLKKRRLKKTPSR
jgi:hypothetical protein